MAEGEELKVVCLSGFTRKRKEELSKLSEDLGARVVGDFTSGVSVLVADSLRSRKARAALGRRVRGEQMVLVVGESWLEESRKSRRFLEPWDFRLTILDGLSVYIVRPQLLSVAKLLGAQPVDRIDNACNLVVAPERQERLVVRKTSDLRIPLVKEEWFGQCVEEGCVQDYHEFLILNEDNCERRPDESQEERVSRENNNFHHGKSSNSEQEEARRAGGGCLFNGHTFSISPCEHHDELSALICSEGGRVVKSQSSDFRVLAISDAKRSYVSSKRKDSLISGSAIVSELWLRKSICHQRMLPLSEFNELEYVQPSPEHLKVSLRLPLPISLIL
eukprot:768027-Hanusia_phi.AAC.4